VGGGSNTTYSTMASTKRAILLFLIVTQVEVSNAHKCKRHHPKPGCGNIKGQHVHRLKKSLSTSRADFESRWSPEKSDETHSEGWYTTTENVCEAPAGCLSEDTPSQNNLQGVVKDIDFKLMKFESSSSAVVAPSKFSKYLRATLCHPAVHLVILP